MNFHSSSAGDETTWAPLTLVLELRPTWSCEKSSECSASCWEILCAKCAIVSSKYSLATDIHSFCVLKHFHFHFLDDPSGFGWRSCETDVLCREENSTVSHYKCILCVNYYLLFFLKKKFLEWGLRGALTGGYKDNNLQDGSLLCPFDRLTDQFLSKGPSPSHPQVLDHPILCAQ